MSDHPPEYDHKHDHASDRDAWSRLPVVRAGIMLGILSGAGVIVYTVGPLVLELIQKGRP